jgi:hypothetical protein
MSTKDERRVSNLLFPEQEWVANSSPMTGVTKAVVQLHKKQTTKEREGKAVGSRAAFLDTVLTIVIVKTRQC